MVEAFPVVFACTIGLLSVCVTLCFSWGTEYIRSTRREQVRKPRTTPRPARPKGKERSGRPTPPDRHDTVSAAFVVPDEDIVERIERIVLTFDKDNLHIMLHEDAAKGLMATLVAMLQTHAIKERSLPAGDMEVETNSGRSVAVRLDIFSKRVRAQSYVYRLAVDAPRVLDNNYTIDVVRASSWCGLANACERGTTCKKSHVHASSVMMVREEEA